MNKKQIITAIGIIVAIIVIAIILEIIIRNAYKITTETLTEKEYNQLQKEENKTQREETLKNYAEEIMNKLKNQDSQYLYSRLNEEYKNFKYPTLEKFEDFLQDFNIETKAVLKERIISNISNQYVYVYLYINPDGDIINLYISYKIINDEIKDLIFDDIAEVNYKNQTQEKNNIKVELETQIIYTDREEYLLNITNNTESKISINTNETILNYNSRNKMEATNLTKENEIIEVNSNNTSEITLEFPLTQGPFISEKFLNLYIENEEEELTIMYFLIDDIDGIVE